MDVSSSGFQLRTGHKDFDDLILGFADLRGIPPQILKAQIHKESGFNPNAYRYEPLTVDFMTVTAGSNLRVDSRFAPWRLQTLADWFNPTPPGLVQGSALAQDSDDLNRRDRFKVMIGSIGTPVYDVVILPSQGIDYNALPSRGILPSDGSISMENILLTNDDTQNWIWSCNSNNVCNPTLTFLRWFRIRSRFSLTLLLPPGLFTGQPVIAASYGLMQVTYITAVDQMNYKDSNRIGRRPGELMDPTTSLDLGTEYLARKFVKTAGATPAVSSVSALNTKLGRALHLYNGPAPLSRYAQPILAASPNYFPVGP